MNQFRFLLIALAIYSLLCTKSVVSQSVDWRNAENGHLIFTNGYCDQPYVVALKNGKWLCVFTTAAGREASEGQHIVSCTSQDHGKTWSKPVQIEEPGKETSSWAMPYLTKYDRVYVFYNYNGDKIHELNGKPINDDVLGWYCYKYSEDEGKTWSQRYRLDVRKTKIDFENDWKGEVQIMWGIGKPVDVDEGMMFAFTKIKQFYDWVDEGWFFRCDNINTEKDPKKLKWLMLPDGQQGLKNEKLGPINEEQNIFQMGNGTIYCMHRTISGYPAESYSYDGGRSWTLPKVPMYENGIKLKNPKACAAIWKCKNGKYLFWYHNNAPLDYLHHNTSRNPAWISGGIEKDGKIIWSQPEILLYKDKIDISEGYVGNSMSYPDLIEQDGKYWVTETDKEDARCHAVPTDFLNMIWSQFKRNSITTENLLKEWTGDALKPQSTLNIPVNNKNQFQRGFTLDLRVELNKLPPGQVILNAKSENGKTVELRTGEYGSVEIVMKDGNISETWNSDPGLIPAYGEHCISVTVDNGPKIIQFVVDGNVCNGRDFRQYGWGRFKANMEDFSFNNIELGNELVIQGRVIMGRPRGKLTMVRIYNRPLMNSEVIGNHRNFME